MTVSSKPKLNFVPPQPPEFHVVRLAFNKQSRPPVAPVVTRKFTPTPKPPRESKLERWHAESQFDQAVRNFWWALPV